MSTQRTYIFSVSGMHCNACVLLVESEIGDIPSVTSAKASLASNTLVVTGDFGGKEPESVARELSVALKKHGYTVSTDKASGPRGKWSEFKIAVPVAIAFGVLFVLLQKAGLVNLIGTGGVSFGAAFVIGIVASLSSCMAVVGGLLLSMSATFAKEGDKVRPQAMFHIGRIVSFFVLGGVIGALGSAFQLSAGISFALSLVIGLVMFVLGINLLDVFPWAKKLQLSMPGFISRRAYGLSKYNHTITPLLVGAATFFLPCGFTQSMQLVALSTGSFMSGGIIMLAFALGTLPVLAVVSFSSAGMRNGAKSGIFFKSAGLIVIMFAILNVISSLAAIGVIPPLFNF